MNGWKSAVAMFVTFAAIAASAQTFTTLLNFRGGNGAEPDLISLVQGADGAFYGTTYYGGNFKECAEGCGTAFKITSAGTQSIVDLVPANGAGPVAGLVLATNGSFYGTAVYGGPGGGGGSGTVFEITKAGKLIRLYGFCTRLHCPDGGGPYAALVQGADGGLYGTTSYGGNIENTCLYTTCGTVFKITLGGTLTTLYKFCAQINCADGQRPIAGLLQASDGSFYGTTSGGGTNGNYGTVFKITAAGTLTTLYSFCSQTDCTDGYDPLGTLVQASDGNFYGTTSEGGTNGNYGTVFKITAAGALTTLYSFCSQTNCTDGWGVSAGLIQGTDGNFYGTTYDGGTDGYGTIFEITVGGTLTTLHNFDMTDGASPFDGLLQGTDGDFYGTTFEGGDLTCATFGCGTVFRLDMGLGPFVSLVRNPARVGQPFGILGQGLTGTTSVSLNGIPANFKVVSGTFIRAAVPAGATSGYVTVTTPSGTLPSNKPFIVLP